MPERLMILVGLGMMVMPFYPVLLFKYSIAYGTYESITGGVWIVAGVVDLVGRGKREGSQRFRLSDSEQFSL